MWSDVKYAARLLLKAPSFTSAAIVILTIAIAGNVATFSAIDVLLLGPLPFAGADRLVVFSGRNAATGARTGLSPAEYRELTRQPSILDRAAAVELEQRFNLSAGGDPVRVSGGRMTAGLLPLLGVSPAHGRRFTPDDERSGAPAVVLITDRYWATAFQRSPAAIGRHIAVDGAHATIVGVLPPDFRLVYGGYALWVPLRLESTPADRRRDALMVVARLASGVAPDRAASSLNSVASRLAHAHQPPGDAWRIRLLPIREFLLAGRGHTLAFATIALGLLLLVACANLATLQLARASARRREIATRLALGASRFRAIRLLFVEAAILSTAGAACALALVALGRRVLLAGNPDLRELAISLPVFGYTAGLALAAAIAFGLVPALIGTRLQPAAVLKAAVHQTGATRRVRSALVVAELAVSLALLAPAGLLVKSFVALRRTSPGFKVDNILTVPVSLPPTRYAGPGRQSAFAEQAVARLGAMTGVKAAAAGDSLPLERPAAADIQFGTRRVRALLRSVSPEYLEIFGVPLRAGRSFTRSDRADAPAVAIVNDTLAAAIRPDRDAVGELIRIDGADAATVIGVTADLRSAGLRVPPEPELFVPFAQRPRPSIAIALATVADPLQVAASARQAMQAIDPELPVTGVRAMTDILDEQLAAMRAIAAVLAALAALALVLATAGMAGIMSWLVTERTHEIGVRTALGATTGQVVALIARDAMRLVAAGVAIGVPAAAAVARLLSSAVWGVAAVDAPVFALVPIVLMVAASAACLGPLMRAARVDSASALRAE